MQNHRGLKLQQRMRGLRDIRGEGEEQRDRRFSVPATKRDVEESFAIELNISRCKRVERWGWRSGGRSLEKAAKEEWKEGTRSAALITANCLVPSYSIKHKRAHTREL